MCAAPREEKSAALPNGHPEPDTGLDYDRRQRWFNSILRAGCFIFWMFAFYNLIIDNIRLYYICLFFAVLTSVWVFLMARIKGTVFLGWSARIFTFSLMALMSYYLALGGDGNTRALWSSTFPMIAVFILGRIEGIIWTGLFMAVHIAIVLIPAFPIEGTAYGPGFTLRYFFSLSLIVVMTYCFEIGRIKVEKILRRNQQLLTTSEKRLRLAYDDLKTAQSQLVQSGKLASIGELASGVAHELNQPLMVIRGNAQLAERRLSKNRNLSAGDLSSFIETVTRNTKRMSTIINHLRSFSRQSTTEFSSVSVNDIIDDTFLMIGEQLRLRGVTVIRSFSKTMPLVKGNANLLEQVFLNLMSNAADALEAKSDLKKQDRTSKRLIIVTRAKANNADYVEILFRDNGEGIPAEHLDTIFDPFFTTKETGKGTGLGLSISYGIIKNHIGKIEVMKTSRKGTTFRILLPAVKQKARRNTAEDVLATTDAPEPSGPDSAFKASDQAPDAGRFISTG